MNRNTIKTLTIAGLLAVSAGAQAWEVFATSVNQNGADVLMTNAPCEGGGFAIISLLEVGGRALHGCWETLPPGRLYVRWDGGAGASVFDFADFTVTEWGQEQLDRVTIGKPAAPAPNAQFAVRRTQ
jgi:hypothetical protein